MPRSMCHSFAALGCSLVLAATSWLSVAAAAQSSAPAMPKQANPPTSGLETAGEADTQVRLGIGDLLEISVYGVPELATKARVGGDGNVYLPLIDYVHVDGLTLDEAQSLVEKRLGDGGFVNNPHVTILISEYSSQNASILGQIAKPGSYPIVGERRLYDLISAAGGLTDRAGRIVVITHRDKPASPDRVNLGEALNSSPASNVLIRPGDTVVVQRAGVVYVVGDVARPSGLVMDGDHLTVLQAIALAGGTTRTAKLGAAKIIRKSAGGVIENPISVKKILQAKQADVALQADDILFIPGSAGKAAAYKTADVLTQVGSLSLVAVRP
ncbi:MAG TPA: polysaccharide biosynthesis/export family protein [Terriglobales bacterium]|nr:polysaccharide biosynthesis/export family protein [Terriglobales bacterium]